jgi:hypothetical protein
MSNKDYKPIFAGSKVIGKVQGGVFYKTIQSKHMLRKPLAIANDISALQDAINAGARRVCITNKDTGITYTATINHMFTKGVKMNRGWGEQIFLPLDEWQQTGANVARQFELFAGVT